MFVWNDIVLHVVFFFTQGAKNMFTKEEIYNEFIKKQQFKHTTSEGKRNIIIFHCEFSSERGPKM